MQVREYGRGALGVESIAVDQRRVRWKRENAGT